MIDSGKRIDLAAKIWCDLRPIWERVDAAVNLGIGSFSLMVHEAA
jgi:hypothetical protein